MLLHLCFITLFPSYTLNTSHIFWVLHFTRHFLKVLVVLSLSDIQLFPVISNSMQLLKELWFNKYLCTSSVVSIKGTWADIKASSWIIYPWRLDCTFHLKCEAMLQCRNKTANLLLGLQQGPTEEAILVFSCKMSWNICNFTFKWSKKKKKLQIYEAKASKVLLLKLISDLAKINKASSFKRLGQCHRLAIVFFFSCSGFNFVFLIL